jgi:murein DD-endopeptidase MepM/ murein hydrolase activator NlpD
MTQLFKILAVFLLFISSSLSATAGVATGFIYPVGNPGIAPTDLSTSGNGYVIAQHFNTSSVYGGSASSPNGGWCATSGLSAISGYTSKTACESAGYKWVYGHTGIDLSNGSCGGQVKAVADGVVEFSGGIDGGYGNILKIRHTLPNGRNIYSLYGHLSSRVVTTYPVNVTKGQLIGYVGGTGNALGLVLYPCHLHFAIFDQDMPSSSLVVPVGYLYGDNGFTTSNGTLVPQNILRYFYDPLLFVNDRNVQQVTMFPGAGSWSASFSNTQSLTSRAMYATRGIEIRSLQSAVSAGWMSSQLQHLNGTVWEYIPIVPMDSHTFLVHINPPRRKPVRCSEFMFCNQNM